MAISAGLLLRDTRIRTAGPDTDPGDGRAYVQVQDGRMILRDVNASYRGSATAAPPGAFDSTFARNLFGIGVTFVRDRFLRNDLYGFDLHCAPPGMGNNEALGSNDFRVRDSEAGVQRPPRVQVAQSNRVLDVWVLFGPGSRH